MSSNRKLIYHRRYPPEDWTALIASGPPVETSPEETEAAWQAIRKRVHDAEAREPEPERLEACCQFVALCKDLSEAYEVDMDIVETSLTIRADVYYNGIPFWGEQLDMLTRLIELCDRLDVAVPKNKSDRTILELYCSIREIE